MVSSDATLLNLSLQSSNLWAILFSVAAFRESPSLLFYIAVIFVVAGVFVYEILGNASQDPNSKSILGNTSQDPNSKSVPPLNKATSTEYQSIETTSL
jgi:hypothetical protein